MYCQHNEEELIAKYLSKVEKGVYVDVGAGYAKDLSNTYHLYLKGWKGLTIEPMLNMAAQHKEVRPNDINLQIAISNYDGEIEMCDTATVGSVIGDDYARSVRLSIEPPPNPPDPSLKHFPQNDAPYQAFSEKTITEDSEQYYDEWVKIVFEEPSARNSR